MIIRIHYFYKPKVMLLSFLATNICRKRFIYDKRFIYNISNGNHECEQRGCINALLQFYEAC